ncbi:ATP-binding protein [Allokutzneria sp. A3M-2-11 16]|uniref:ATP-binding protein n=1 Tax=Allokutzneria sp. A3M-2-11 16 TaxID=2962043 RepID=UPI0020B6FF2F|nr:ATP-binding protein [Allokutzneria sp. A3M-2-11 16]MCP3802508.1 ATP-binding protein [Allokutzneria sp. A3M-2-11 16]
MRRAIGYLPRRVTELVLDALSDTRVVVVNGARQVGKSTLAEHVLRDWPNGIARFLDDAGTRSAAQEDPARFVVHDGLMLIDEVQRVPDLWLAIKHLVDREPRPGRFLLTGSARLLGLAQLPDSLPGRSETIELWPLSQGEIEGAPDGFVDAAFAVGAALRAQPQELRRKDYLTRAARGGYPEAVRRESARRRERFFEGYLADLIARDVKQVADIRRSGDMRRLLSLLAAQTSGLLNVNRLAGNLNITAPTARDYVEILETIYLVRLIPAWAANVTTRAVATPKLIFLDTGLASYLSTGAASDCAAGNLIENFVLGEIARQLTWSRRVARLYHYRDRDQYEVDGVLEDNAGRIIGIEVKAAETVRTEDFRGLKLLQRRLGSRFHAGFVLYCGTESLSFGDGLTCLPISALWTTHPQWPLTGPA